MTPKRPTRRLLVLALLACAPLVVSTSQEVDARGAGGDAAVAEGGVCDPGVDPAARIQAQLSRAGAAARAAARSAQAGRDVIALNGRGYNYAAAPARELERSQRERLQPRGDAQ